jgi:hypothetical protein
VRLDAARQPPSLEPVGNDKARQDPPDHGENPAPDPHPTEPGPGDGLFGGQLAFGIANPGNDASDAQFAAVTAVAGAKHSIELWYRSFTQELRASELAAIAERGAIPYLTWEPWGWRRGASQPTYRLSRISDGAFDPYLTRSAEVLADWGKPILLRFGHEMNGGWYPWSEAANRNRPGDYVRAWNHIQDLFATVGADNVIWVWSPNVQFTGSLPLLGLYPGNHRVDVIAVDGYNFGTSQSWSEWVDPDELFDPTFATLRALAPEVPLMLGEVASSELGGDKAAWIDDLFTWMRAQDDLEAFVWFDLDKGTDWRLTSSLDAAAAVRANLTEVYATR